MSNARLESAVREPGHICCTVFPVQQLKSSLPEQPFILTRRRQEQIAVGTADGQLFVRDRAGAVVLKNRQDEALQGDTGAGFGPEGKSSWQLNGRDVVNLKYQQDEAIQAEVPARSVPGKKSSLQQRGGSHNCKITTRILARLAQGAETDPMVITELRKNIPETPIVVSAAADASSSGIVDQDHSDHSGTQRPAFPAAPLPHSSSYAWTAAPPALQVPIEQLDEWRADVAEQRQVVAHAQAAYARAGEALGQCSPGGAGWGELRREQRYLEHQLEAEQRKLEQFELFVSLIEHGSTRDDVCEQVYSRLAGEASPRRPRHWNAPPKQQMPRLDSRPRARHRFPNPCSPKLGGLPCSPGCLRSLAHEAQHLNQNSRGLANKAAMLLQESGIRPEQLPRLKQLFEQAYPTVKRDTPIALANHCTEFAAAL